MKFTISRFPVAATKTVRHETLSLEELRELFSTFDIRTEKDGPLWCPAIFTDTSHRTDQGVSELTCFVLDFDGTVGWDDFLHEWRGLTFFVHTSFRHTDESPRWRAVFPLSAPVPAGQWQNVYGRLSERLGFGQSDPACKNPSRLYWLPARRPGSDSFAFANNGQLLNPMIDVDLREEKADGTSVGDDFDQRASWEEILEPAGWHKVPNVKYCGKFDLWSRPGKEAKVGEHGARTGVGQAGDRCVIWTDTGVPPQFVNKALKKYMLYAVLRHGGDVKAAIKDLSDRGFGSSRSSRPKTTKTAATATATAPGDEPDQDRPQILTQNQRLHDVTKASIAALAASNCPEKIFISNGKLCRVEILDNTPQVALLGIDALRGELSRAADYVKVKAGKTVLDFPPREAALDMLALSPSELPFPVLDGVSSCPIVSSSGFTLFNGYDTVTKYKLIDADFTPFAGTANEAAEWLLNELLVDFPFDSDASRAHAMALMLLPIVRPAIDGPTPLHLVDAPIQGSGKSLLVKACLLPALGREPTVTVAPDKETDLEKKLFAAFVSGRQAIFLDNISRTLASDALAAALTAGQFEDRILGHSQLGSANIRATFAATANNVQLSTDIARRCIWIRLDPKQEDPETREGFRHKPLLNWIKSERKVILGALVRIVQAWLDQGRPTGTQKKGSYESWAEIIGGILHVCDIQGLLDNDKELKKTASLEEEEWSGFIQLWYQTFRSQSKSAGEVRQFAANQEVLEHIGANSKSDKARDTAFGMALRRRAGRVYDGYVLENGGISQGKIRYYIHRKEDAPFAKGGYNPYDDNNDDELAQKELL